MTAAHPDGFTIKPVVVAVTLAMAASTHAAPTPNQLPGAGRVTDVSAGATVNGGGANSNLVNLASPATITLGGAATSLAVINWGGNGAAIAAEVTNPIGFNIGSAGKLTFTSSGGTTFASVLNIDASGNPSQIYGQLESSTAGGGVAPSIFVANGNGIVVGASGRIAAPTGVGLIGANLNNPTARFDFVANNSAGTSFVDITSGQSTVTVNGAINGSLSGNVAAGYTLMAGGDIVNTGNVFANVVWGSAGLRATPNTATVNGVAGTTVNRLWDVTNGSYAAYPALSTTPGGIEIATVASTFVNTGSMTSSGVGGTVLGAAAGVRSGTAGDANVLVGLFSDGAIYADTYASGGKVELYNTVSGYSTNKSLDGLIVNGFSGITGNEGGVVINALTPGSQPSSISAVSGASIMGTDVAINSTINHTSMASESILEITSSKSLTVTAAIGAGGDVSLTNTGSGALTISGNVVGDTNKSGAGTFEITSTGENAPTVLSGNLTAYGDDIRLRATGALTISGNVHAVNDSVYIDNLGMASGNTTTISGNVTAGLTWIFVNNYGTLDSNLNISGTLTSKSSVYINSYGNLQLGKVDAGHLAQISVGGLSSTLNAPVTGTNYIIYFANEAITRVKPAAVLASKVVVISALTFQGVNASGAAYANAGEKPAAQIVTNSLMLISYGNFNAPIAGNTNWLTNQVQVSALDPLAPVNLTISAVGAGFQAINIGVTGNASVNSENTYTPFNAVGLTTGTTTAGGLIGNGGSQLIVNASGNLDIWNGDISSFFEFPGGIAFKAGGVLTQHVPVYNAWTLEALPYQGVFFEAPTINALSYIATNGNSWANWSVKPVAGAPTVYQITQPAPTTFSFVANPTAAKQNTYSLLITGTPVNTCPGFPPNCN